MGDIVSINMHIVPFYLMILWVAVLLTRSAVYAQKKPASYFAEDAADLHEEAFLGRRWRRRRRRYKAAPWNCRKLKIYKQYYENYLKDQQKKIIATEYKRYQKYAWGPKWRRYYQKYIKSYKYWQRKYRGYLIWTKRNIRLTHCK